jgi:hypothetical protein
MISAHNSNNRQILDRRLSKELPATNCGKICLTPQLIKAEIASVSCGRGQVVRHQPSKLIFAGPNPVARSDKRPEHH